MQTRQWEPNVVWKCNIYSHSLFDNYYYDSAFFSFMFSGWVVTCELNRPRASGFSPQQAFLCVCFFFVVFLPLTDKLMAWCLDHVAKNNTHTHRPELNLGVLTLGRSLIISVRPPCVSPSAASPAISYWSTDSPILSLISMEIFQLTRPLNIYNDRESFYYFLLWLHQRWHCCFFPF